MSNETPFSTYAWEVSLDSSDLDKDTLAMIEAERQVPVEVSMDTSLRPKIIDSCGMTCTFCHNEGTPVSSDYKEVTTFLGSAGISGRFSVFSPTNGVNFLPGKMMPDDRFTEALAVMRDGLGLNELHLTGGEPTLHSDLPRIVEAATIQGYNVKMTSNGENGKNMIPDCAAAGLSKINFSIFGTTPEELAEVQNTRYSNVNLAAAKIAALHRSIATAVAYDVEVGANIVMSNSAHAERVKRVLDEFEPKLGLRILPDLDSGNESYEAIYSFLGGLGAEPVKTSIDAGSSNTRVKYRLPDGREVDFKQIRALRMPETCSDCELNNPNDCKEGYYGVRLYVDQSNNYKVGVCLQRMDLTMPLSEFITSNIYEDIRTMRDQEYVDLINYYQPRNDS